MYSKQTRK